MGDSGHECFVLSIETHPVPKVTIWDVQREGFSRRDTLQDEAALGSRWAMGAVADFDADQAVVALQNRSLQLWDFRMLGRPVASTNPDAIGSNGCFLQTSGLGSERPRVLSGGKSGKIHMWDASGQGGVFKPIRTLYGHNEDVRWATMTWDTEPSGYMQSASLAEDGEALFWDFPVSDEVADSPLDKEAEKRKKTRRRDAHPSGKVLPKMLPKSGLRTRACAFNFTELPEALCAATGSADGSVRLWKAGESSVELMEEADSALVGHTDQVSALCVNWRRDILISASLDRSIRTWDISSEPECTAVLEGHEGGVRTLVTDWQSGRACSASTDDSVRLWDIGEDARCLRQLKASGGSVRELYCSFAVGRAAASMRDGGLQLWDLESSQSIGRLDGHPGAIFAVQLGCAAGTQRCGPADSPPPPCDVARTGGDGWSRSVW